ncbi:peptidyl-tRNA hydrolase [Spirochaetia bacterium]|nr:peptidyl-tRNA hydrolase [Spirochaetia bacterium]GHU29738.1 peptidyl-tRNA hydrolase [Spirochaetia bacterium]
MIELVVFLGNPGESFAQNRHNAGRLAASQFPLISWHKKYKGLYALALNEIHFLMPETFMNNSGESVHEASAFFKIPLERILIVHDELDLPLGTMSLKNGGGLNGHNGLRSINKCCGGSGFWRLRIGIGRPVHGSVHDWVLSDFTSSEWILLKPVLEQCTRIIVQITEQEPETLLPDYAKKSITAN